MVNQCNVIKDILPLYIEGMVSEDTKEFVETHISDCDECKKELEELQVPIEQKEDFNLTMLRGVKRKIFIKKLQVAILAILGTIVFGIAVFAFLTAPIYIPYEESGVEVKEEEKGEIVFTFYTQAKCDVSYIYVEGEKEDIYDIMLKTSLWNNFYYPYEGESMTIIYPNNNKVSNVYYIQGNGEEEDVLIYGPGESGIQGRVSLPRLVLNYYFMISIVLFIIIGIIYLIMRLMKRNNTILKGILFIPLSYLIAHLCIIRGFTSVFNPRREFEMILLVGGLIYIILWIVSNLIRYRKKENKKVEKENGMK